MASNYGPNFQIFRNVQISNTAWRRLDLDGSGVIDYTEFCAAGIGERISLEAEMTGCTPKAMGVPP